MGNALWLLIALPDWYFSSLMNPLVGGPLTIIAALGIICLGIGALLGVMRRDRRLLLFLVSTMLSEIFVGVAGALRGKLPGSEAWPFLIGFLVIQVIVTAYIFYRLKGARLPATLLLIFSLSYAMFASFVAAMAFSDTWL